jgi:replicative DNA helicase
MAKQILQDLAAERAVLSGLCQYGLDTFLDVDFLEESHFFHEINQIIYRCVSKVLSETPNVELSSMLSAANQLGLNEMLHNAEEVAFIRSLFNFPIHRENVVIHAAKLAKLKLARDVKQTLKVCEKRINAVSGDESIADIISIVETPVLDVTSMAYQSSETQPEIIGENVDDYIEHLQENPSDMAGISTGFPLYDYVIGGGLRRKCVDLIGARPKIGKSMFADSVALHAAKELNIPVLMLDTEMSKEDHLNRMLANLSSVEINNIQNGKFGSNDTQLNSVQQGADTLKSIPYHYVSVAGQSFENILSLMRKWIYQHVGFDENGRTNDCLIIYDYFKLMHSEGINNSMQEFQLLGFQITQLHNFCVKYDVPCLSFVQLNRDGITRESTDVASGSDRLIWLCTSFTLFKAKSDEEQADDIDFGLDDPYNRKLVPLVARHGAGLDDGDYINMKMIGKFGKISQGATRNNLKNNTKEAKQGFSNETGLQPDISTV